MTPLMIWSQSWVFLMLTRMVSHQPWLSFILHHSLSYLCPKWLKQKGMLYPRHPSAPTDFRYRKPPSKTIKIVKTKNFWTTGKNAVLTPIPKTLPFNRWRLKPSTRLRSSSSFHPARWPAWTFFGAAKVLWFHEFRGVF